MASSGLKGAAAVAVSLSALVSPAQATNTPPTAVVIWNRAALVEVRLTRQGPPIAARALAVAHTCMYEAWVPYDTRALSSVPTTIARRPAAEATAHNKAKAVSYAAYRCLVNLYPAGAARLEAVFRGQGYDPADQSTNPATAPGIGNAAAAAVIASRRHDGSNQYGDLAPGRYADYTGYAAANAPMPFCLPAATDTCNTNATDPNRWQPLTGPTGVVQSFIAPHWERVRPFALSAADQFDQRPEAALGPRYRQSAALLQADMDEILHVASTLDPRKKLIIEYWADGPESELPPGHWGLFAQAVSARDSNTLDEDVRMYFAMHNASFDAGIVAWHLKRKYDGVRPITAVRRLLGGRQTFAWGGPGRPNEWIDAGTWTPYNPGSNLTPAFPGWVSGHATFSAASAAVLRAFTGSDHFGYSTTLAPNFGRVEPGVPAVPTTLTYPTFTAAANEAALTRLLAGIHFSDDNSVGLVLGDLAGKQAWGKAQFLFDGGLSVAGTSANQSDSTWALNWQHTVEGLSNRLLIVGVTADSSSNSAQSVSYAGRSLSRLGSQVNSSGGQRVELWYLIAPPVGTATISVRMTQPNDVVAGATNHVGVNQQTPFGTFRAASGNSNQACVTMANEPAALVATVKAVSGSAGSVNAGPGQMAGWQGTSRSPWIWGLFNAFGNNEVLGKGGTYRAAPVANVCSPLGGNARWTMIGVPLKPALQP